MSKTIIFCADGTWNGPVDANTDDADADTVESGRTNVFKLFANLNARQPPDAHAREQERDLVDAAGNPIGIAKYLHGVGDSNNAIVRIVGGSVGAGLISRIVRGYTFVSRNYEAGDDIILVGFSRGAYTARALAGLIAAKGALQLTPAQWADKDQAYRLGTAVWYDYIAGKHTASADGGWWSHIAGGVVRLVQDVQAVATRAPRNNREVATIRAVGVWDTVGALGVPVVKGNQRIDVFGFADNVLSPKVRNGFHAIAIDEQRVDFTPALWASDPADPARVHQVLFPGAHSDVGGGYPMPTQTTPAPRNECGLSDGGLAWMTDNLAGCGVQFSGNPMFPARPDAAAMAHQPWLGKPYKTAPRKFDAVSGLVVHASVNVRMQSGPVGTDPSLQQGTAYAPMNLP